MKLSRTTFRSLALSTLVAGAIFGSSVEASAGTATSSLSVTATVSANCTISTSTVAFGAYDPVGANASSALNGTGGVTVTCTSGSSGVITLGQGAHAGGGSTDAVPVRQMSDGGTNRLGYHLYQDSGRATAWGNTAGTGVTHVGTGSSTAINVYGAVTSGQQVPAGSYSDSVLATITF